MAQMEMQSSEAVVGVVVAAAAAKQHSLVLAMDGPGTDCASSLSATTVFRWRESGCTTTLGF